MAAMEDSSFGRLIGALIAPDKTFRSIAGRPTWAVALLVVLAASAAIGFVTAQRTDYRDVITQTVRDKGRDVSEAQLEPQIEMMEKAGPAISGVGAPVVVALITLFVTLLYWVAFKLLGSDLSYKSGLSVTLHASMPAVVSILLSLPVVLGKESIGYADMKRSGGGTTMLQSNLAFLAPDDAASWLVALLASVDFFSLWSLVLSVIGFRAVTRLPTRSVAVTVIVIWLIFVAIRVGWVALFG